MSFPKYPAYRQSGTAWVGDIPEHWVVFPLARIAASPGSLFVDGDWIESKDLSDNGIRYLTTGNVGEGRYKEQGPGFISEKTFLALRCTEVLPGDVLISRLNVPIGRACVVPALGDRIVTSVDNVIVRPDPAFNRTFLAYLLSSKAHFANMENLARGTTMQRISRSALGQVRFAFPPAREQTDIAAFLDRETAKIDALVEEQKRLIELLKEKRQAVISQAVTKGLDPSVPMKDSGVAWLGEVPESWKIAPLKRLCDLLKDGTHLPPPRVTDGVPLLSVRNIQSGVFSTLDDDSLISEESYQDLCRSFVPQVGDVLLAIVGATLGKTALVPTGLGRFHIQRSLAIFRPAAGLASGWLHLLFQSNGFQSLLWENVGFSAQPGIYLGTLAEVRVPVPPADLQASIVHSVSEAVRALDDLVVQAEAAVSLLTERRSALISAAVTGKIDVRGLAPQPEVTAA